MIMTIKEYIKRKIIPKEGDIIIIRNELYQVVNSGKEPGRSDACVKCSLNCKQINNRECIYSFIEGTYDSCAEFIEEPYILRRIKKEFFNGV